MDINLPPIKEVRKIIKAAGNNSESWFQELPKAIKNDFWSAIAGYCIYYHGDTHGFMNASTELVNGLKA